MSESLEAWILFKLLRHRNWGGKHISFDNLPKGQPKHIRDQIREVAKDLMKQGLILAKPTHYGLEVSLNPQKKEIIVKIISKYYKIPFEIF